MKGGLVGSKTSWVQEHPLFCSMVCQERLYIVREGLDRETLSPHCYSCWLLIYSKLPIQKGGLDFPIVQYADDTILIMEACPVQLNVLKEILHTFSMSTGLNVNYNKTVMVPINVSDDRMNFLASSFGCQKGDLPFTYLGLPLGTTKPKVEAFLPLVQRIEKRLTCTSTFLTQGGKLEMVNSVFSSTAIYHYSTIKMHKEVIKQVDKYMKHCLWRGADLNSKKPHKAAWE